MALGAILFPDRLRIGGGHRNNASGKQGDGE
jgi:hypothetical protein